MSKPNFTWKPIDLGGFRLYKVILHYYLKGEHRGRQNHFTVVASSPSQAAGIIERIYKTEYNNCSNISHWHVTGHALDVLQPAHFSERGIPCLDCEPKRFGKWRAE